MRTSLPPTLTEVVRSLLDCHPDTITLEELAEAIGDRPVTPPQIAEIMRLLESEQRTIAQNAAIDLPHLLRSVLASARRMKEEGRAATIQAIAEDLAVPASSVHAALLYSRTLGGP